MIWGPRRIILIIAVVIFVLAAIGSWPASLQKDLQAVPLGLALLAASFVLP